MLHPDSRVHGAKQFGSVGMELPNENEQRGELVVRDEPNLDELCFGQVVAKTSRVYVAVNRTNEDDYCRLFDGLFNDR